MSTLRNILVVLDPTAEAQPALDKAGRIALETRAALILYACDPDPARLRELSPAEGEQVREQLVVRRRAWLERLATYWREAGLHVDLEAQCGSPLHEILVRRIATAPPDLVVKDTHPHSLLRRTLLTHTDWQLIRGSRAPLLLVRPEAWSATPRFVAAIDPGHAADRSDALDRDLLEWTLLLSRALGGTASALNICFPPSLAAGSTEATLLGWVPDSALATRVEADRLARVQTLQPLVTFAGFDPAALHVAIGTPEALPEELERLGADVVAMGAVSRSALKRLVLGSVAEFVLDRLPCDLLVVKPFDVGAMQPV
jgi:universal stress protein E